MTIKKDLIVIGVLVLIILAGGILFASYSKQEGKTLVQKNEEGVVTLALGQTAKFGALAITPLELIEDSRCAEGLQCIWAGTVRVKLQTVSGLGTSEQTIEMGKSLTTEAEEIKFLATSPSKQAEAATPEEDYRFTFEVQKRSLTDINPGSGGCFVGGCSGQICSDEPNVVSTCEFRAEYACYRTAKCERQTNGECGWTESSELKMCLQNPSAI
jgi:hypothetical protein